MNDKYCPSNETHYSSLIIAVFALGVTLWGVIAIISGLMDNYYQHLGYWITVGDIVVLILSLGGCVFFVYMIIYFVRCGHKKDNSTI